MLVAEPPLATEAVPVPTSVQFQTADTVQLIVMLEVSCDWSLRPTAVPAVVPPSGENTTLDLPRKLSIEIVPDGTPANVRTAVSPSEIVAVADLPSSVFTWPIVMVPVGSVMVSQLSSGLQFQPLIQRLQQMRQRQVFHNQPPVCRFRGCEQQAGMPLLRLVR